MGTNYYGRIIPKENKKQNLIRYIHIDAFDKIKELTNELYERFDPRNMNEEPRGEIHLGKGSWGWKFLWNPNIYRIRNGHIEEIEIEPGHKKYKFIKEPDTAYYLYPLTKKGIKEFIDREDLEIYDEYDNIQDKEEFFKMALEWTKWGEKEAYDSDSYYLAHPEEKWLYCKNDYTDFLESLGYKLSKNKNDFYSDGLRFSTFTEFC